MKTKLSTIELSTRLSNYDVIIGTETWLDDSIGDGELFDSRYNVYRRDRASTIHSGKRGGGVLIAVLKSIDSARISQWETDTENLWVRLKTIKEKKCQILNICAVYLPPPVHHHTLDSFLDKVSSVIDTTEDEILIAGDFNLSFINWEMDKTVSHTSSTTAQNYGNALGYSLIDFLSLCNMEQIIIQIIMFTVKH